MRTRSRFAALLMLGCLAGGAQGEERGPGDALNALPETAGEAAQAEEALALLETAARSDARMGLRQAKTLLRSLGGAAEKRVARLLLTLPDDDARLPHLTQVLAAFSHAEVDDVLDRVAARAAPALRAAAADALASARGPRGVNTLARLAADDLPGVRAAALRALFARDDREAVAARAALPPDADPALEAFRLRLFRLRGDGGEAVGRHAQAAWTHGRSPALRLAGGRLLASPSVAAPTPRLLALAEETGQGPVVATALRALAGLPLVGYDAVEERWVAVSAALEALHRPDLGQEDRVALIDRAVEWLAHPVPMDPEQPDPIPELALRRALPDLGAALLPALERRMQDGGFAAPRDGTTLAAELAPEVARPLLVRLLEAGQPHPLRVAASGALRRLGALGDEALARRLTSAEEEASIRRDALSILATEPAAWAVPLLGGLLDVPDAETREAAADALESRGEPEARTLLEAFVTTGRCPEHRLAARLATLFTPWDAQARALLPRALVSPRAGLRSGALMLVARFPLSRLRELLPLLREHEPRLKGAAEVEAWVPAMLRAAPAEGLAWIRAHWDDAPVGTSLPSTRCRMLAALDHVRDPAHLPAVVDLALEKAGDASDAALLEHAVDGLSGRRGARDADLDAFFRRLLEGRGLDGGEESQQEVAAATVSALESPGRGDLTSALLPLLERTAADPEQGHRAVAILRALVHQPFAAVERVVLRLALDGTLTGPVRSAAAQLLVGRASAPVREQVLARLLAAESAENDAQVLLSLAAAAGTSGGPETALRLRTALVQEVTDFYARPGALDPFAERLDVLPQRVQALAAGVAHTGHAPSLDALVSLLVDPTFAPWADEVLARSRPRPHAAGVLGALDPTPGGALLRLEDGRTDVSVLLPEVAMLALGLKTLGDEALAASLTRVLADPALLGPRGAFPDAWTYKLAALLHDPRSGDHVRSAAVLEAWVGRAEPEAGPFDAAVLRGRMQRLLAAGALSEAADAADALRRLEARRGYDLSPGSEGTWRLLEAQAAGARAAARREPAAAEEFARAVERAGDDARALAALALSRADVDLDAAETLAARALALDRRADGEESLPSVAAFAEVLLRRGRPDEAARRLESALERAARPPGGRLHLLLAEACVQAGDLTTGAQALRRSLVLEPSLEVQARASVRLAPLAAEGRLERAIQAARDDRASGAED